jgi:hypothetical protein
MKMPVFPAPKPAAIRPLPWLGGAASFCMLIAAAWLATSASQPEEARQADQQAIERCWMEQLKPSFRPGDDGPRTCERMESDYLERYGKTHKGIRRGGFRQWPF